MLWAAAGENRPSEGRLTAPSALALYPVRVYAILAEGAYLYDAKAHTLTRVAEGDLRKLSGAQEFVFSAPLNLVYVADLSVYDGREIPAERARYLCGQDAAGYAENVNLYTAGHGLRSITRAALPRRSCSQPLGWMPTAVSWLWCRPSAADAARRPVLRRPGAEKPRDVSRKASESLCRYRLNGGFSGFSGKPDGRD